MTLYFDLDGIDFAVMGEKIPGYRPVLYRFEIKKVWLRGPAQNIAGLLDRHFLKRLAIEALERAQHPVPLPYDVPTPRMENSPTLAEVNARRGFEREVRP